MKNVKKLRTSPENVKRSREQVVLVNTLLKDHVYTISNDNHILVDKKFILNVLEDLIDLHEFIIKENLVV